MNNTANFEVTLFFPEAPSRSYTTVADVMDAKAEIESELMNAYGGELPTYQIKALD